MRFLGVALVVVVTTMIAAFVACGDEDGAPVSPIDASSDSAIIEEEAAPPACLADTKPPAWLDTYLEAQLAKLTGAAALGPDAALIDRATAERRALARDYLKSELEKLGITTTIEAYATGANVVGRLGATKPNATDSILIGAHYDGVARTPGANDNATGVAAVLAVAKMLTEQSCREHDVVFVMFDEEELGLVGSTAFAFAQPDGGAGFRAVHTIDQVGWDNDDDKTFEIERPTNALYAEYQSAATVLGVKVVRTSTNGSDHQPLRERGYPAAGVTEEYVNNDTSPHRHQPTDTAATVNRPYLALAVRLVALVVARELGAE